MHTTLIIMAAGLGTRFGDGIKQLAPVGPGGECIMEYSVYDAIEAGFDKIVFIIRKEIEKVFRKQIGERLEKAGEKLGVEIVYVYQEKDMLPDGVTASGGERKALGDCAGSPLLRGCSEGTVCGDQCRRLLWKDCVSENTCVSGKVYGEAEQNVLYGRICAGEYSEQSWFGYERDLRGG